MDIAELRAEMDVVDKKLIRLADKRLRLARKINKAKRDYGLPIRDPRREEEIVHRTRGAKHKFLKPSEAEEFSITVLEMTRRWVRKRLLGHGVKPLNITIVGLGLIGGSLARSLKRATPGHRVNGVDLETRIGKPRASGLFAEVYSPEDGAKAVENADVIFLCTPANRTLELLSQIADHAPPSAIVTDVAGVKRAITERAAELFTEGRAYFVGGHPMAGKAENGFENSDADLFMEHIWVLTPGRDDPVEKLKRLHRLIQSTGASLQLLMPDVHDQTVCAVSHLPQLASVALMLAVGDRDRGIAGDGLLDSTRLAGSPGRLWNELVASVRNQDVHELRQLRQCLEEIETAIAGSKPLEDWFSRANALRRKLEKGGVAGLPTGE